MTLRWFNTRSGWEGGGVGWSHRSSPKGKSLKNSPWQSHAVVSPPEVSQTASSETARVPSSLPGWQLRPTGCSTRLKKLFIRSANQMKPIQILVLISWPTVWTDIFSLLHYKHSQNNCPSYPKILVDNRAQWTSCLRRKPVVVRLLGSRVRIPFGI
jgi:hypothetical protein